MPEVTSFDGLADAAESVWSLARVALLAGALGIFAMAVVGTWRRSRRTEIVISTLADGTGDATTAGAVVGLTYRLREGLLSALPQLAEYGRKTVKRAETDSTSPLRALVLDDIARDSLLDDISASQEGLTDSMESLVPEKARAAYRVVASTLLRRKQVHVSGVLQRRHDRLGGLGLSFTVHHVGSDTAASRITVWEDGPSEDAAPSKPLPQRFHELVVPASRLLACELLRQRLLATVEKRPWRERVGIRKRARPIAPPDAVVEFLVGNAYQSDAHHNAPATKSFYKLAERALKKSVKKLDHYKVSFQLATTLGELARLQSADVDEAINLLLESTKRFEEARDKLPRADLAESQRRAETLKLRAAVTRNACLMAQLLPDDVARSVKGAGDARDLMTANPGEYEDEVALYNVACSLAVAAGVQSLAGHGLDLVACRSHAERWLLHACARGDEWWKKAEADPDLCLLREWVPRASQLLRESMSRPSDTPPGIAALVDRLLEDLARTPPSEANSARPPGSDSSGAEAERAHDPVASP